MVRKGLLKLIICSVVSDQKYVINTLKLNQYRPATAWGFQKQLFNRDRESDFYNSWNGVYHYKYDTGNTKEQMFRDEKRYSDGSVVGFFGYIDPDGILRITEYVADRLGYRQRTTLRFPVTDDL